MKIMQVITTIEVLILKNKLPAFFFHEIIEPTARPIVIILVMTGIHKSSLTSIGTPYLACRPM
jgi:hypothetical protein